MKIAMIGQKGIPARFGGVETNAEELAVTLAAHGHTVFAFCRSWYTPKEMKEYKGVHLVHAPTLRTKHLDAILHTFTSIIKASRMQVDVIHIHGVGPALLAWLPRIIAPKTKVVVTFHCLDRNHAKWNRMAKLMLWLGEWMACKVAHATITSSRPLQEYCRVAYKTETACIPYGVSPLTAGPEKLLGPFGLESMKYFACITRLVPHKRVHDAIEAWKQAKQARPDLFIGKKLAIVGGSAFTDSYVASLHELAKDEPSIVFTGYQTGEALRSLFGHAYVTMNPSESEGLPTVVIEAMMHGKAVIGADIPETMELIADEGIPYPVRNVEALTEKIIWALEHPSDIAKIGVGAKKFALERHGNETMTRHVETLYAKVALPKSRALKEQVS